MDPSLGAQPPSKRHRLDDKKNNQLSNEITFNGDFDDFDFQVDKDERNKIVADFNKVMTRFQGGASGPGIEGIQEISKTLQDLQPFNDIIYLYIRFACQQQTSNFNTDSLCSLVSVAKQCNMKPCVFLNQVKSLELRNNNCSKYGLSFSFVTRNTKDVDGVFLEKIFLV